MEFNYQSIKIRDTFYQLMKIYLVFILGALLCYAFSLDSIRAIPKGGYSGTFAASWLGGFCWGKNQNSQKCDDQYFDRWDRQSFTIHGLWPSTLLLGNEQSIKKQFKDFRHAQFDLNSDLFKKMKNYWPPKANDERKKPYPQSDYWLWWHEYQQHGKFYSKILQIYNLSEYGQLSDKDLQLLYFEAAIKFYLNRKLKKIDPDTLSPAAKYEKDGLVLSKKQLSQLIKINQSNFHVRCGDNRLIEIKICYRISNEKELKIYDVSCKSIQKETTYDLSDSLCKNSLKLIKFKVTNQKPVTLYEDYSPEGQNSELQSNL